MFQCTRPRGERRAVPHSAGQTPVLCEAWTIIRAPKRLPLFEFVGFAERNFTALCWRVKRSVLLSPSAGVSESHPYVAV
jgi:hypothetical protein